MRRPAGEPWSDEPTRHFKFKLNRRGAVRRKDLARARRRLKVLRWARQNTISVQEDLERFLAGHDGKPGFIAQNAAAAKRRRSSGAGRRRLIRVALGSRQRLRDLLASNGIDEGQRRMLAEMMLWRSLAYSSTTLAHGSFGPDDKGDVELQGKARDGLQDAVAKSFRLGDRIRGGLERQDRRDLLRFGDLLDLHAEAIKAFPEREPGKVRRVNFKWPHNPFGVHWPTLHGENGWCARLVKGLERSQPKDFKWGNYLLNKAPLEYTARTLYWIHNIHPMRDGNGRTEVLGGWSLASAAGFPLPLEYDQDAGDFKLAAAKWGGSSKQLRTFLARGALGTERFARTLMPLLKGHRIVSTHTDHGAVGAVIEPKRGKGQRRLLVMLPVNNGRELSPELQELQRRNRPVVVGDSFAPTELKIRYAIDGKHNTWHETKPATVARWRRRYAWWSTAEPIFSLPIPREASFVDFQLLGPGREALGASDYYLNLKDYRPLADRGGQ